MHIYLLDSYALSGLADMVPPSKLHQVLNTLTGEVTGGVVRFPDSAWKECCLYQDEHSVGVWARAVAGSVSDAAVSYEKEMEVLNDVPELLDEFATEWQAQVDVAALALHYKQSDTDFTVVTEDNNPRPDRMPLTEACAKLDIESMDLATFLDEILPYSWRA